jgi:energy-coupling factor transporter ATP-binding protein EcfA2
MLNNSLHNAPTFKKFKLSSIEPNSFIMVLGKRGSGKTSCMQHILWKKRGSIRVPMLYSKTAESTHVFDNMIPQLLQYKDLSPEKINEIILYCADNANSDTFKKKFKNKKSETWFIGDDILADKKWMKDKTFRDMVYNGRNYNMTVMLAVQDGLGLASEYRDNVDYIFVTGIASRGKKVFYEQYWEDDWGNYDECMNIVNLVTTKESRGSVLVVDKKHQKKDSKLTDSVFYLQLKNPNVFTSPQYKKYVKIGSSKLWEAEKKLLDPNWKMNSLKYGMQTSGNGKYIIPKY